MGLIHGAEAWIIAMMGWAWLTVHDLWFSSLLNSFVVYSMMLMSTVNLALVGLMPESPQPARAYMGGVFSLLLFYLFAVIDSTPGSDGTIIGAQHAPPPDVGQCCSNADVVATNRKFYFGGTALFQPPAGVTLGYLSVQTLVAGAQQASASRTIWPGYAWGANLGCLLSLRLFTHFSGLTSRICPDDTGFNLLIVGTPAFSYSWVFLLFWVAFVTLTCLEALDWDTLQRRILRGSGLCVAGLFALTGAVGMFWRGMLTPNLLVFLFVPGIPYAVGFVALFLALDRANPMYVGGRGGRTSRWIVPLGPPPAFAVRDKKAV